MAKKKKLKVTADNIGKYRAWVRMARVKRKNDFEIRANRLKKRYKSSVRPDWDEEAVDVNLVFPNIEIAKPSIYFRNPKIFVRATQKQFILDSGVTLDGPKAAGLLEDAANYVAYSIKLKKTVKQVRDDALIVTYGVIMVGYEGVVGITDKGNPYIKDDSIFGIKVSPYKFLVDTEAVDCYNFSDARWVAREKEVRWEDFEKDDWYENKEDAKSDAIGYSGKVVTGSEGSQKTRSLIDFAGKNYEDTDDAKRITLIEMWIKGGPGEKSKVVVFSMSGKKKPHKVLKWPYKIKKMYPFRGLAFYKDNEEFYPISDVDQYWQQLEELNIIRSAQLKHMKTYGMKKIVLNVDAFESEEEITKLEDEDAGPFIRMHAGAQGDVNKAFSVVNFGSAPSEMFMVDKKVVEDADKISGITDLRRGTPPPGMETATEGKILYGAGSMRFSELKDEMADFFEDVARLIVRMIKQFWTTETMVRRLGTLTPEWTDEFSADDIDIEDDVEIDIGEMVPMDEMVRKKFALDKLELIVKGATNPSVIQKLAQEGYEINIAEAIKDAMREYGLKNDKLITKMDPNKFVKILMALFKQGMGGMGERGQAAAGAGGGGGAATDKRPIPAGRSEHANQMSVAHRGLSVPGGEL